MRERLYEVGNLVKQLDKEFPKETKEFLSFLNETEVALVFAIVVKSVFMIEVK
jgi:hypothetical protein